ncbi:hypothetical protein OWR29_28235 [Actinoplanes sp. Pm04-4]|uniref:Uncharacterized protein n=1 Tax=Paractinoplanes pyxinae TaxID=2997416 RepID=A0ABT4B5Z8_9ACTN|nr:hypothetical protein [Actinoplanes pyxinae]MCY1141901.1 hypothetical protein [Actinoplanes pyxinae]
MGHLGDPLLPFDEPATLGDRPVGKRRPEGDAQRGQSRLGPHQSEPTQRGFQRILPDQRKRKQRESGEVAFEVRDAVVSLEHACRPHKQLVSHLLARCNS